MVNLKAARKKLELLSAVVRNEAFDDWITTNLLSANRPDEWTRAAILYEHYLKHAKGYGNNMADKAISKVELATETAWGKMMGSLYPEKKRRRDGWYYPLRLKRGA